MNKVTLAAVVALALVLASEARAGEDDRHFNPICRQDSDKGKKICTDYYDDLKVRRLIEEERRYQREEYERREHEKDMEEMLESN